MSDLHQLLQSGKLSAVVVLRSELDSFMFVAGAGFGFYGRYGMTVGSLDGCMSEAENIGPLEK